MEITPVKSYDLDRYPALKERFSMRKLVFSRWSFITALAILGALMQGCRGPS